MSKPDSVSADNKKVTQRLQVTRNENRAPAPPPLHLPRESRSHWRARVGAALFLAVLVAIIGYALYLYQIKPLLTTKLPEHAALPTDTPPVELTGFQVRLDGELLSPNAAAVAGDTLLLCFVGKPFVYLYSGDLQLIRKLELTSPEAVNPTSLVVTDSLLIVADASKQAIAIYDREGFYLASTAWYPGKSARLNPAHLSANLGMLLATDSNRGRIAVVSLIERQPFYDFLELVKSIPTETLAPLPAPTCALMTPDSNIWVGDRELGRAFVFTPKSSLASELEQPRLSRIKWPVDMAFVNWVWPAGMQGRNSLQDDLGRVHLLDREEGKVFVYDLTGKLTLVYPQDRALSDPVALTIDNIRRQIYVAEAGSEQITVFGY